MTSSSVDEAARLLDELKVAYTRQPDGTLFVDGDIKLMDMGLDKLPDLSCVRMTGMFNCSNNNLASLEGSPSGMSSFICHDNPLGSLKGAPRVINGHFNCMYTGLFTLEGAPEIVTGNFFCSFNELETLAGGPREVGGRFSCAHNRIGTLDGIPEKVTELINVKNNRLPSLKGLEGRALRILSDFGDFPSWDAVPPEFRISQQEKDEARRVLRAEVRAAFSAGLPVGSAMPPRAIFRKKNSGTKTPPFFP